MLAGSALVTSGAARRWSLGLLIGGGVAYLCCSSVLADLRYDVEITGVEDSSLADLLDEVSELKSLEDRPPPSEEALRRRADRDLDRLQHAAHSLGYWNAQFSYEIDANPVKVVVVAHPGPLYRISSIDVLGPAGKPIIVPIDQDAPPLPLKQGDPARRLSPSSACRGRP